MNNNCALRFDHISKSYKKLKALDDISLSVPTGSITGLIGPNGAGKTTALALTAGLVRPDAGKVDLLGDGPYRSDVHKGRITLLPQDAHFPPQARVNDLLHYFARLQGLSRVETKKNTDEILEWVNLSDRKNKKVSTLSHGMFRRLTIAQAFLGEPEIVLLDEPMSGLDPEQVISIRKLIARKKTDQTIIISSHILTELEAVCDYVIFINEGRTKRQDTLDSVVNKEKVIFYFLEGSSPPVAEIERRLPNSLISFAADKNVLTIEFHQSEFPISEINARVIPVLFEARTGIREIRTGQSLEQEFLKQLHNR